MPVWYVHLAKAVVLPSFASSAQRRSMFASHYTKAFWEGVFKIKRSCQSRFDSYERTQLKYASICYINIIFNGKQRHKAILLPRTAGVVTQLLPSKWLPYYKHLQYQIYSIFPRISWSLRSWSLEFGSWHQVRIGLIMRTFRVWFMAPRELPYPLSFAERLAVLQGDRQRSVQCFW